MVNLREFIIEREGIIREALEDYKRWWNEEEANPDKVQEINNTLEELRQALDDANEFYPITHLSKEDLKYNLLSDYNSDSELDEEDKQMLNKIDNLTEEQMIAIADNMSEIFNNCDDYSLALKEAYRYRIEEK